MTQRKRIGPFVPPSNSTVEPDFANAVSRSVHWARTAFELTSIRDVPRARKTSRWFLQATRRLIVEMPPIEDESLAMSTEQVA